MTDTRSYSHADFEKNPYTSTYPGDIICVARKALDRLALIGLALWLGHERAYAELH